MEQIAVDSARLTIPEPSQAEAEGALWGLTKDAQIKILEYAGVNMDADVVNERLMLLSSFDADQAHRMSLHDQDLATLWRILDGIYTKSAKAGAVQRRYKVKGWIPEAVKGELERRGFKIKEQTIYW